MQFETWAGFHFSSGRLDGGRITPAGMSLIVGDWTWQNADRFWRSVIQPAFFLVVPSRGKFTEEFKSEIEKSRPQFNLPYRLADWKTLDATHDDDGGLLSRLRLRTNVLSILRQQAESAEDELGHRDGVLVGIALEQYHRAYKTYPTSLDPLVPAFLHEIPVSRVTGEPVSYRLLEGKPIIYSVGHADWMVANYIDPKGNWILYPRAGY